MQLTIAEPAGAAGRITNRSKNVETSWGALTMRWGGVLLAIFIVFHLFHFTGGMVGFQPGQFEHLMVYQNVVAGFSGVAHLAVLHPGHGRVVPAPGSRHLEHAADAGLGAIRTTPGACGLVSRLIALVIFAGFVSVPISVLAGWVR